MDFEWTEEARALRSEVSAVVQDVDPAWLEQADEAELKGSTLAFSRSAGRAQFKGESSEDVNSSLKRHGRWRVARCSRHESQLCGPTCE